MASWRVASIIVGAIRVDPHTALTIAARLLLGAPTLIFLDFAIAYLSGPSAASAILNLVYVPLAFASGLFLPLDQRPPAFQQLAQYLFTSHYARLAWSAVSVQPDGLGADLLWLVRYAAVFLAIGLRAYRTEALRKFG